MCKNQQTRNHSQNTNQVSNSQNGAWHCAKVLVPLRYHHSSITLIWWWVIEWVISEEIYPRKSNWIIPISLQSKIKTLNQVIVFFFFFSCFTLRFDPKMKQLKIPVGICDGYTIILQINGGNQENTRALSFFRKSCGPYIHYKTFYL